VSEVLIVPDAAQAAEAAAELFVESVVGSVAARGRALVALTGGSSAPKMYAALRQKPWVERVPWNKLELMVGDDRCVPETDVRSNWGVAQKELFSKVPIDPLRLHRMRCEAADAEAEAERFEEKLHVGSPWLRTAARRARAGDMSGRGQFGDRHGKGVIRLRLGLENCGGGRAAFLGRPYL